MRDIYTLKLLINNFMKKGFTVNQEFLDQYNLSPAARDRMIAFIEQAREPKSEETRERMRQAKLGKPKAPVHIRPSLGFH